jgi:altronate dehydratase
MTVLKKSMLIETKDNVAIAIEPIEAGDITMVNGETIIASEFIDEGHKIARVDIPKGAEIIKYGTHIGFSTAPIKKGDWVHEHNVYDDFEEINNERRAYYRTMDSDALDYTIKHRYKKEDLGLQETIMGYPRKDGRFGIRNNIIVISLVQCSNNAAIKIANACNVGATFVDAACGEFPERFARTYKGFIAAGTHPNTYGVVLLSLGCQQTNPKDVMRDIEKTGRPVVNITLQDDGGVGRAVEEGIKAVNELKNQAASQEREPCPLSGLVICGYNGGSDWTSGLSSNPVVGEVIDMHASMGGTVLHIAGRGGYPTGATSYEVGMKLMDIGDFFENDCKRRGGKGLSQVNPTPGNKAGGLTTLTEKNLGSFKTDGSGKIKGILNCGDQAPAVGEWGINQAQGANDAYALTTLAMGGCHICLFTTGRGSPIGNACMTIIKVTGNPRTAEALSDMVDFSAKPVLYGEKTVQERGRELYEFMIDVVNGKTTKAEKLNDYSWITPHGTSYNGDY